MLFSFFSDILTNTRGDLMEKVIEAQIINPTHHFIYGENNKTRTKILNDLANSYPLEIDKNKPRITYVSDIGLPEMPLKEGVNIYPIELVCQEYIIYSIALVITEQILNSKDYEEIEYRSKDLFEFLDNFYFKADNLGVRNYEELKKLFEKIRSSFSRHYESYCNEGNVIEPIITSFSLSAILDNISRILNNFSNNIIILDNKEPMNSICYQAINSLIRDVSPSNTSFNVATSFEDWKSYYTFAGHFINYREDYQIIDLDGNFARTQEEIIKKYSIDFYDK